MKTINIIFTFFLLVLFSVPVAAWGIEYQTLMPITGHVGETVNITESTFSKYLDNMFKMGIALCTGLAVLMIIIGGIQYVSSDAWGRKSEGKERILAALLGLVIALGSYALLKTINPDLLDTKLVLNPLKIEGIKVEYNRIYAQWTDADDTALNDQSDYGYQAALKKWDNMQSQIKELDAKHGPQVDPATANVGPANQKVLEQINKGDCSNTQHCYASAVALGNNAGVNFNSVFQNEGYKVDGNTNFKPFGTAREPVPGEMVDIITRPGNSTPYHTVIVYSNDGNGRYTVWDWKNNTTTGLRKIDFNLDKPGTKGYIGRIYVPKFK
jgi:hypothetical protein